MTNGETYFIHKKDLNGEYVRTGSVVYFSHYKSKNRKNNAVILNVIEFDETHRKALFTGTYDEVVCYIRNIS